MCCTSEEKFDYAVSLLQSDAYDWWETVSNSIVQPPILTWDDFLRDFRDKYMPEVYRDEKQREFLTLRQGNMSVAEYEVKFTQLSHYALAMVATERDKCRRFEEGLKYDIRSKITPADLRSYTDLRAAAIRAERLIKERPTFLQRPKREGTTFTGETSGRPSKRQNYLSPTQSFARGSVSGSRGGRSYISGRTGRGQGQIMQPKPICQHCGRQHMGECRMLTGGCYFCGQQGHFFRDCPNRGTIGQAISKRTIQNTGVSRDGTSFGRGRGRGKPVSIARCVGKSEVQSSNPQAQARVFALTRDEAITAPEVITGKLLFHNLEAYVLIDPGSTHSFISPKMASHLHKNHEPLNYNLSVHTPLGDVMFVNKIYRDCSIQIGTAELYADLILLSFREFDLILGMDWLSRHHAKVDCYTKEVVVESIG